MELENGVQGQQSRQVCSVGGAGRRVRDNRTDIQAVSRDGVRAGGKGVSSFLSLVRGTGGSFMCS